jgi:hypothetical protein
VVSLLPQKPTRASKRWRVDHTYRSLAYEFRIRTNLVPLGLALDRLLSPFRTSRANGVPGYTLLEHPRGPGPFAVYGRRRCLHRAASPGGALDFVLWDANLRAIDGARDHVVLHAAAAAWRGQGILLPAPPDSGKTTLVAALTRAGFAYLTDEAALIEPEAGWLHPFPRALWMDGPAVDAIPNLRRDLPPELLAYSGRFYHVPPEVLRSNGIGGPCRVRYVVAPSYQRGARTKLEPITRAAAITLLAENSFNFGRFGAAGLAVLAAATEGADCYRMRIGDLQIAVNTIMQLVGSRNGHGHR